MLGNAHINVPGGTASIEGPGDSYGGTNDDDNSGVMKYVRIEYPGIAFSPNNEINGLTFGGVGRGTTIDYIQVSFSGDDSYEWFGGTVNCKHLIAYRGWDDDFDTDFGFSGNLQFLVSFRDPEIADQSSSNGFESDNDGSGSANTPLTSPTWWNVTLVGPKQTPETTINSLYRRGMHLRRNSQNKVNNALIMGWHTGILLDGSGTTSGAVAGTTFVKNSIISATVNRSVDSASANAALNPTNWFVVNNSGRVFSSNTDLMLNNPFNFSNPSFVPMAGSPVLTGGGTPPDDGFFDASATFVGAFGSVDWTAGWADWTPAGYANGNFIGAFGNVNWTAGWSEWTPDGYIVVGVKDIDGSLITDYKLNQNYPNPFNPATKISYAVPNSGNVKIEVLNLLGEKITELVNRYHNAGIYEVNFDASRLSSGIYFYRLEAGSNVITKKMTLLK